MPTVNMKKLLLALAFAGSLAAVGWDEREDRKRAEAAQWELQKLNQALAEQRTYGQQLMQANLALTEEVEYLRRMNVELLKDRKVLVTAAPAPMEEPKEEVLVAEEKPKSLPRKILSVFRKPVVIDGAMLAVGPMVPVSAPLTVAQSRLGRKLTEMMVSKFKKKGTATGELAVNVGEMPLQRR
jgi:hypothetical protein